MRRTLPFSLTVLFLVLFSIGSACADSAPSYNGFWGGFRNIPEASDDSVSFRIRRNNISDLGIVITGVCTTTETSESYENRFVIGTSETPDFLLNRRRGTSSGMFEIDGLNSLLVNVEINLRRNRVIIAAVSNDPENLSPCEAAATYRIRRGRTR